MTWETIATDGKVIGNPEFLSNYWDVGSNRYNAKPARIKKTKPNEDHNFRDYDFQSDSEGLATLTIRKEIVPIIKLVLGLPSSERLQGRDVTAYYKGRRLMGFGHCRLFYQSFP